MADAKNLADPDYEPTDEDLQALVSEAFRDVPERNARLLARLREHIADLRREARARSEARPLPTGSEAP